MAQELLAPWAEPVPGWDRPLTVDELMALPDDGWTYELVEGRLVRMAPSRGGASHVAMRLGAALDVFVEQRDLGRVTTADGEFVLSRPGQQPLALAPDAAFVPADRAPAPGTPEWDGPWQVVPDLVVEVAAPKQYRPGMAAKARQYLGAGVRLVWVVWPRRRQVDVWRTGSDKPAATLAAGDVLDGLDVLPGFTYPVARLFV
jgi:Uma2 family endonuclease